MNLQDKANHHHSLAQAYQEGLDAVRRARSEAFAEAKQSVASLKVEANTCMNPGETLTKAAVKENGVIERALDQLDQLTHHHFPQENDDDMPF